MYRCEDCGMIFEEPKIIREPRGEFWGAPAFEDICVCPYCDSTDFDDYDEDEED